MKVEKYVKKAPVELSIATEGSGEPHANLFKGASDSDAPFLCPVPPSPMIPRKFVVKYVKKHPVDVSTATAGSGEPHANLFKKEPLMWFLFFMYSMKMSRDENK